MKHWLELVGPAIYSIGLAALGIGYIFSKLGISFGEEFWERLSHIKIANHLWSYVSWRIAYYLERAVLFLWILIFASFIAYSFWPDTLMRAAVGSSADTLGTWVPTYSAWDRFFLESVPAAMVGGIGVFFVAFVLERWVNRQRNNEQIAAPIILLYSFAVAGLAIFVAFRVHWYTAVHLLPAIADDIVRHYEFVGLWRVVGFGVMSMAVYPIPVILVAATGSFLIQTIRRLDFPSLDDVAEDLGPFVVFFTLSLPGAIASMHWTLLMLVLGNWIQHESVTVSLQLLIVNAIFDGLTIYFAVTLFQWASFQYRVTDALNRLDALPPVVGRQDPVGEGQRDELLDHAIRAVGLGLSVKLVHGYPESRETLARLARSGAADYVGPFVMQWRASVVPILAHSRKRAIPAFGMNCVVAAVLSCSALYFALWRTPSEISLVRTLWIFTGGFNGNSFRELGPLFWVTHSTFLPTLFMWIVIIFFFLAAYIVNPIGDLVVRFGRRNLTDPKSGLLKYGGLLLAIGPGIDLVCKFLLGIF